MSLLFQGIAAARPMGKLQLPVQRDLVRKRFYESGRVICGGRDCTREFFDFGTTIVGDRKRLSRAWNLLRVAYLFENFQRGLRSSRELVC